MSQACAKVLLPTRSCPGTSVVATILCSVTGAICDMSRKYDTPYNISRHSGRASQGTCVQQKIMQSIDIFLLFKFICKYGWHKNS